MHTGIGSILLKYTVKIIRLQCGGLRNRIAIIVRMMTAIKIAFVKMIMTIIMKKIIIVSVIIMTITTIIITMTVMIIKVTMTVITLIQVRTPFEPFSYPPDACLVSTMRRSSFTQ